MTFSRATYVHIKFIFCPLNLTLNLLRWKFQPLGPQIDNFIKPGVRKAPKCRHRHAQCISREFTPIFTSMYKYNIICTYIYAYFPTFYTFLVQTWAQHPLSSNPTILSLPRWYPLSLLPMASKGLSPSLLSVRNLSVTTISLVL